MIDEQDVFSNALGNVMEQPELKTQDEGLKWALENTKPNTLFVIRVHEFEDSFDVGIFSDITQCFGLVNNMIKSNKDFMKEVEKRVSAFKEKHPKLNLHDVYMQFSTKDYDIDYSCNTTRTYHSEAGVHRFWVSNVHWTDGFTITIEPFELNEPRSNERNRILRQNDEYSIEDLTEHLGYMVEDLEEDGYSS